MIKADYINKYMSICDMDSWRQYAFDYLFENHTIEGIKRMIECLEEEAHNKALAREQK